MGWWRQAEWSAGRAFAWAALGLVVSLMLGTASAPVSAVPRESGEASASLAPCSTRLLDQPRRGADAVRRLGASIGTAAARSGTTAAELSRRLRADRTMWLDACGLVFYADELPGELPDTTADGASWPATISPAGAFALHSRPDSTRVLYLDFDGQLISGTVWNTQYGIASWEAPAFSLDADATMFSDAERTAIIEVWQRVAQDYAPFGIDVTTQDPGADAITRSNSADARFGTRVLISPDSSQSRCGCAGIAYLDVVDRTYNHAYTQPAWVFPQELDNRPKFVAEAVSHESGHNFGLDHDGTQTAEYYVGSGGWGPLMGSPYNQAVTQWSDGSYPGASNTEDDLAVIAGNGAPLVTDDAGDSASASVSLGLDSPRTGLLNTTGDVDTYRVSVGAGLLTASVEPSWPGPNVDLSLALLDGSGAVLASAAPAYSGSHVRASLSASVSVAVPAGTYTLQVEGVGNGIPGSVGASDYGSVGWYSIQVAGVAPDGQPSPEPTTPNATPPPTQPSTDPSTSSSVPPAGSSSSPAVSSLPTSTEHPGSTAGPTTTAAARALSVESRTLPTAKKRVAYRTTLVAAGGSGGCIWKRTKGKLPTGLKLSRTGLLSGKAKKKGTARFRVRVTDSSGARSSAWVRLRVR